MNKFCVRHEYPEGWQVFGSPERAAAEANGSAEPETQVIAEYHREIAAGHPLHGVDVEVVADQCGNDDILVRYVREPDRYAVVHLTWSRRPEIGGCPTVDFDGTFADLVAQEKRWSKT